MKTYNIRITGATMLLFGKMLTESKQSKETHEQFEERIWRKRAGTDENGHVIHSGYALPFALEAAGKRLQIPIKGAGKSTYTKLFRQGVCPVGDAAVINPENGKPVTADDLVALPLAVPSDGQHGGKKRVVRIFPHLRKWGMVTQLMVLDDKITEEVLMSHLVEAGQYIGMGAMRAENGHIGGRFHVDSIEAA